MARTKYTLFSWRSLAYYAAVIGFFFIKKALAATEELEFSNKEEITRYPVAEFTIHQFEHVATVYSITFLILVGCLAKIGFHVTHTFGNYVPESVFLITLGVLIGGIIYGTKLAEQSVYVLNPTIFFLFLLPPIILEAGYFMPNR